VRRSWGISAAKAQELLLAYPDLNFVDVDQAPFCGLHYALRPLRIAMMLLSTALLVLSSLLCEAEAGPSRKHAKYDRRNLNSFPSAASHLRSRRSTSFFLTNATKPFAVNGSALPDVHFDIGESYAGLLPIDDTSNRELFFWFVPTTNPAANDEIMIWLNGGPGCSSLDGFFHENGPVIWQAGSFLPVPNTWTWVNLTSVVWVEQPVGTGYSRGHPNATSEIDVADQFRGFWRNFVDLFKLHDRKVYITGESYGEQTPPGLWTSLSLHASSWNVRSLHRRWNAESV
jgi:Serine carboxypeptidase